MNEKFRSWNLGRVFRRITTPLLLSLFAGASASEPLEITWPDLIDQAAQTYEDPFRDLPFDQLQALRTFVRLQMDLTSSAVSADERSDLEARLTKVEAELASADIDAKWLISQRWIVADRRETASRAGNTDLDAVNIKLGGFAIPAPPEEDGTRTAYLVPERGMCSHTPPPPANQLIRLTLGDDWSPSMMHEPVVVSGHLTIDPTERQLLVVDGLQVLNATFSLDVDDVQTFVDQRPAATQSNTLAKALAKKRRDQVSSGEANN
ncbi:DUF3299 domain-containing protein [Ruegeria sp. HKCCD4884]|uniref:DUF3299 domain-containing protein n=1 Tax=Ruegeria sp. HKCCD4884 TaxID=2683022 RepID=UPI001491C38B|nr:DUF3299 domain-containing protein [Ruegeria sp. HKCCD4884]NOD91435.1 DUF3299 domain-containing protein [Ruegeria sp. HKCCD4884]